LKALTEKFSIGVVEPVDTKPLKRKRREKMLMNSHPVARDAEIKGGAAAAVSLGTSWKGKEEMGTR
jgi:hypothetical protein